LASAPRSLYLRTGEDDLLCLPWPGDVVTRSRHGAADLKDALVAEVNRRASRRPPPAPIAEVDLTASRGGGSSRWSAGSSRAVSGKLSSACSLAPSWC